MKLPMGKSARAVWSRRIKGFWFEYSHNRIGLVGLLILFLFIGVAIFSPFIAPYDHKTVRLESPRQADFYAVPDWLGVIVPQLADLPPQTVYPLDWTVASEEFPQSVEFEETSSSLIFYYNASKTGSREPVTLVLNSSFTYSYVPMRLYSLEFGWSGRPDETVAVYRKTPWGRWKVGETGSLNYMLQLELITPNGTSYAIWDQNWDKYKSLNASSAFWSSNSTRKVLMYSDLGPLAVRLGYNFNEPRRVVHDIFESKGLFKLRMTVTVEPGEIEGVAVPLENATGSVSVSAGKFTVWGLRWGILGTDGYGHDVFSQLIHGARISILIGVCAAFTATSIGLLVGITAGYSGGGIDEGLMRIVDILLCLPVLPMLLVFIALFGYNTWYIVLIIAIFGWQGLSRIIRSETLSIRETTFVESSVASGGSRGYIILRHIMPNVLPTALASLVLAVPGAVILEAALSFLGLGDPYAPTWGKMLHHAQISGAFSPMHMAWWDVLPPGLAITFLCLAFVFIGHAIDEIVNPRLRRRR